MTDLIDGEFMQGMRSYAEAIFVTDRAGNISVVGGELDDAPETAATIDLIVSAVQRFGNQSGSGELDTIVLSFENKIVVVAETDAGHVAVLAESSVKMGLLISHIRRLQQALEQQQPDLAFAS